jgi:ribose 1,5-bisphosphokinase PhnN
MILTLPEAVYWEEKVVKRARDLAEVARRRALRAQGFEDYESEVADIETEETEDMSVDETVAVLKAEVAQSTAPSNEARNAGDQCGRGAHQSNKKSGL